MPVYNWKPEVSDDGPCLCKDCKLPVESDLWILPGQEASAQCKWCADLTCVYCGFVQTSVKDLDRGYCLDCMKEMDRQDKLYFPEEL